jgi:F0F1-type ATP synthase membrane subunit b/b'
MKKQALTIMEQSRKSSEREKAALRQAQEALGLKESAVAEALQATKREDYMLDLMTEASQDMAGALHCIFPFLRHSSCVFSYLG